VIRQDPVAGRQRPGDGRPLPLATGKLVRDVPTKRGTSGTEAAPQGAVLFALGVYAGETGWPEELSRVTVRQLGGVAAAAAALSGLLGFEVLVRGDVDGLLEASVPLDTALLAVLDGMLAVAWTVWCIAWFQRRWNRHGVLMTKAGRASYATYVLHPLVLTTLMVLFAVVSLAPALKFLTLSVLAVPACFLVGYALTRMPGASRIL
jgi:peptidoglycan/LPS O-acetylase OafA/YrhL